MLRGSGSSAGAPSVSQQQQQQSRQNDAAGDPLRAIDVKHEQQQQHDAMDCVVNAYASPAEYFCQEPYAPAPPPPASFYNAMAPSKAVLNAVRSI